jgi:capsular exopolysaccharide synthesis family protein
LETTEEIAEVAGIPLLGEIPKVKDNVDGVFNSGSPAEDAFRRLRANLFALDGRANTIVLTSADPKEGKSTVAANLARSIAQSGRTVIVVDGDSRIPALHSKLGGSNAVGLTSVLTAQVSLAGAIQPTSTPRLSILASGPPAEHPGDLLGSPKLRLLIENLAGAFDVVIVDSPPLLHTSDALTLASIADGYVLVARQGCVSADNLRAACAQLSRVGSRPLGVVVNRVKAPRESAYQARSRAGRP